MSSNSALNLANLPSDIIRMLLHLQPVTQFDRIRLISPRWNALIDEHLTNRTRLPAIKTVCYGSDYKRFGIWMSIPGKYRKYFGVERWSNNNKKYNTNEIVEFNRIFGHVDKNKYLTRMFKRCSQIETFGICKLWTIDELETIASTIGQVHIATIEISELSSLLVKSKSTIFNLVQKHATKRLLLKIHSKEWHVFDSAIVPFISFATRLSIVFDLHIIIDSLNGSTKRLRKYWRKILKELCEGEEFSATVTDTWQTSDGHTIVAATFHYEPLKRNLKLTDLSPEIIQNIVKRAPLSAIDNIRLISPLWNSQALEYISHLQLLPVIERLDWSISGQFWALRIHIQKEHQEYFGLERFPSCNDPAYFVSEECVDLGMLLTESHANRLKQVLNRCLHIERFEITANQLDNIHVYEKCLGGVVVKKIIVTAMRMFNKKYLATIFEFVRGHGAKRLYLNVISLSWSQHKTLIAKFLALVTPKVATVEIYVSDLQEEMLPTFFDAQALWQTRINEVNLGENCRTNIVIGLRKVHISIINHPFPNCDQPSVTFSVCR